MANDSLEQRIKNLEETNNSFKHEIERLRAVNEIQNLMSRNQYYHWAGMYEEAVALFARKTPGVKAEFEGFGIFEGIEGIRKIWVKLHRNIEGDRRGVMTVGTATTPVIEVAGDLKTAKGVWISPGIATAPLGDKIQAAWRWSRFGVDFVKEDGQWKFWRLHVYGMFMTPYDKSWADVPDAPPTAAPPMAMPDELKADRPNSYSWSYSSTSKTENVPAPPEPYETYDEATSYVG